MKKVQPPFLRSAYNYDTDEASDESGLQCKDPTLTQQHFAEEADINYIAERFGLTGEMPTVLQAPRYGDFTGIFDFQSAQNAVVQAKQQFMTLPAKIRAQFDNNPQRLLEFLDDKDNAELAMAMGLIRKPEAAPAVPAKGEPPSSPPKAGGEAPATPPKGKDTP